ncbi:hypothetical protein KL86DYS2_11775 [uncultured Dysgonomonas sp.]|uniref:Uncharacterized protein n=1 Tax=uncultured Dysgonomonas sp. TaxID=206096 RepID=A0A212JKP1_9BACT|nr:hypothetical protein KL86DYS2_11775 [uncultured Dysgonomonas sp.]
MIFISRPLNTSFCLIFFNSELSLLRFNISIFVVLTKNEDQYKLKIEEKYGTC